MRLGLSQASYRWTTYPHLRYDVLHYRFRGWPLPYGLQTRPPAGLDGHADWTIDRAAELGLTPLYMASEWLGDPATAASKGARMAALGLEYAAAGSFNLAATEDEWPAERAKFVRHMALARAAGARLITAIHDNAYVHNHYTRDPPVREQIRRMIRNFGDLLPEAEAADMVVLLENHMDYRVAELVQVVEALGSARLRFNYDFANSWCVVEDQVEAARIAAPYTVMTHIKDMRAQGVTQTGEPRFFHAPIGYGDVEVLEILEVLQRGCPDPDRLPLCLEVCTMPQYDPDLWMRLSLDWLREHARRYLPA
jgi:sugar phosphate isomerase/epimerase